MTNLKSDWLSWKFVGSLAFSISSLLVAGCSGKSSIRDQYAERSGEIQKKYDAMIVRSNTTFAADRTKNCDEFIEQMKSAYSYWRPGPGTETFCAKRPSHLEQKKLEVRIRQAHNRAVAQVKAHRLEHLSQVYKRASEEELKTPERAASQSPNQIKPMPSLSAGHENLRRAPEKVRITPHMGAPVTLSEALKAENARVEATKVERTEHMSKEQAVSSVGEYETE